MKKMYMFFVALFFVAVGVAGCGDDEERMSNTKERICENLKENNTNQYSLLEKWKFAYFAYTHDGNKIELKSPIQKGYMHITSNGSLYVEYNNQWHGKYSVDTTNHIIMQILPMSYAMVLQDELNISNAINNAQCYAIKGDSLFIHFLEEESKNILVLEKIQD